MKRIIFVGIHNKYGKAPLCSSTVSGKVIDMIIENLPNTYEIIKSNLFDADAIPSIYTERLALRDGWEQRIKPTNHDVIILLGRKVQRNFKAVVKNKVEVYHPSHPKGYRKILNYVEEVSYKIADAVIPEQNERDREIIPKFIIVGRNEVDEEFKEKMLELFKKEHKRRNCMN